MCMKHMYLKKLVNVGITNLETLCHDCHLDGQCCLHGIGFSNLNRNNEILES